MSDLPQGYLGGDTRIGSGPAPELVAAGYRTELRDAGLLHRGLTLADIAHVLYLRDQGIMTSSDAGRVLRLLVDTLAVSADDFPYDPLFGDAYNSRERYFSERIGLVAGWLHTGRTRREAGRIAFRIAMRELVLEMHAAALGFARSLAKQADRHADTLWADSTYLQPAQPSTFGHYLGGFAEEASRHLTRIEMAFPWVNAGPVGSGGVGGSRLPMDRDAVAAMLGFATASGHTRDGMWATDVLVDVALAVSQAATTASRLAEDIEIFASPPFDYVTLDASLCRASVLLPQKRNPYALAVLRSGAGTLIGRVTGLMVTQRTPSARTDNWLRAYGEIRDTLTTGIDLLALATRVADTLEVHTEVLAAEAGRHFVGAADLAEELVVALGLDYRSAYRVVGRAVSEAIEQGSSDIDESLLARAAESVLGRALDLQDVAIVEALEPRQAVSRRVGRGACAPAAVREHAVALLGRIDESDAWRDSIVAEIQAAEDALVARGEDGAAPV